MVASKLATDVAGSEIGETGGAGERVVARRRRRPPAVRRHSLYLGLALVLDALAWFVAISPLAASSGQDVYTQDMASLAVAIVVVAPTFVAGVVLVLCTVFGSLIRAVRRARHGAPVKADAARAALHVVPEPLAALEDVPRSRRRWPGVGWVVLGVAILVGTQAVVVSSLFDATALNVVAVVLLVVCGLAGLGGGTVALTGWKRVLVVIAAGAGVAVVVVGTIRWNIDRQSSAPTSAGCAEDRQRSLDCAELQMVVR